MRSFAYSCLSRNAEAIRQELSSLRGYGVVAGPGRSRCGIDEQRFDVESSDDYGKDADVSGFPEERQTLLGQWSFLSERGGVYVCYPMSNKQKILQILLLYEEQSK